VRRCPYWNTACQDCAFKSQCTTGPERRITQWENEHLLEGWRSRFWPYNLTRVMNIVGLKSLVAAIAPEDRAGLGVSPTSLPRAFLHDQDPEQNRRVTGLKPW
jgi:hypothetical protein